MDPYRWNKVIAAARERAQTQSLSWLKHNKTCRCQVARLEYNEQIYSSHPRPPIIDLFQCDVFAAHQLWEGGKVEIVKGGACDIFKCGELWGYRPWRAHSEPDPASIWLRVVCTKLVSLIAGLAPVGSYFGSDSDGRPVALDFYLPDWFLREVGFTLEGEPTSYYAALLVRASQ